MFFIHAAHPHYDDQYSNPPNDTSRPPRGTFWEWPHFPGTAHDPDNGIPDELYNELVRYAKYASGAYQVMCPRPMGNTLVAQVRICPIIM